MKFSIKIVALLAIIFVTSVCVSSCSRGTGCPSETANSKAGRRGAKSHGHSGLFPKDMSRKTRVN